MTDSVPPTVSARPAVPPGLWPALRRCFRAGLAAALLFLLAAGTQAGGMVPWWWQPPLAAWIPLLLAAAAAAALPAAGNGPRERRQAFKVKIPALLAAGCFPFIHWWLRHPDQPYLAVCAMTGFAAGLWFLFEAAGYLMITARLAGSPAAAQAARTLRLLFYYAAILPFAVVLVIFLWCCAAWRLPELTATLDPLTAPLRFTGEQRYSLFGIMLHPPPMSTGDLPRYFFGVPAQMHSSLLGYGLPTALSQFLINTLRLFEMAILGGLLGILAWNERLASRLAAKWRSEI